MVTTITTTAAEDPAIASAMGSFLNLTAADGVTPRNATAAEVKTAVINWLRTTVREVRQAQAISAAKAGITDINPT